MTKGYITEGKATSGHAESLRRLGFETVVQNGTIVAEVSGFVTGTITLPADPVQKLAIFEKMIADKQAMTYGTQVIWDGKVVTSVMLCGKLRSLAKSFASPGKPSPVPDLSCLVMLDREPKKKAEARPALELPATSIFGLLGRA